MYYGNLTPQEEHEIYGDRIIKIGTAYKSKDAEHMYLQRENDVLHINISWNKLINTLNVGFLNDNDKGGYTQIPLETFITNMKATIYSLDINNYWES